MLNLFKTGTLENANSLDELFIESFCCVEGLSSGINSVHEIVDDPSSTIM